MHNIDNKYQYIQIGYGFAIQIDFLLLLPFQIKVVIPTKHTRIVSVLYVNCCFIITLFLPKILLVLCNPRVEGVMCGSVVCEVCSDIPMLSLIL